MGAAWKRATGDDDQDGQPWHPPPDVPRQLQAVGVGIVNVVHDQQEGVDGAAHSMSATAASHSRARSSSGDATRRDPAARPKRRSRSGASAARSDGQPASSGGASRSRGQVADQLCPQAQRCPAGEVERRAAGRAAAVGPRAFGNSAAKRVLPIPPRRMRHHRTGAASRASPGGQQRLSSRSRPTSGGARVVRRRRPHPGRLAQLVGQPSGGGRRRHRSSRAADRGTARSRPAPPPAHRRRRAGASAAAAVPRRGVERHLAARPAERPRRRRGPRPAPRGARGPGELVAAPRAPAAPIRRRTPPAARPSASAAASSSRPAASSSSKGGASTHSAAGVEAQQSRVARRWLPRPARAPGGAPRPRCAGWPGRWSPARRARNWRRLPYGPTARDAARARPAAPRRDDSLAAHRNAVKFYLEAPEQPHLQHMRTVPPATGDRKREIEAGF